MSTHLSVLDGEEHESTLGFLQERLLALGQVNLADKPGTVFLERLSLNLGKSLGLCWCIGDDGVLLDIDGLRVGFGGSSVDEEILVSGDARPMLERVLARGLDGVSNSRDMVGKKVECGCV
jgi:hypothetical protein